MKLVVVRFTAGLVAIGVVTGVIWICGATALPSAVKDPGIRWGVAGALGAAVAAVAAVAAWTARRSAIGSPQPRTAGGVNQITGGRFHGPVIFARVIRSLNINHWSTQRHYEATLDRAGDRIEEARRRSLRELARIELDLVELPGEPALRPEMLLRRESGDGHRLDGGIIQAWRESQHSLLLLGAPGAGKTTMLIELAADLASAGRRGREDNPQPLPILIDLMDWHVWWNHRRQRRRGRGRGLPRLLIYRLLRGRKPDHGAAPRKQDPAEWLVSWLGSWKYRIRPGVARQWLKDDQLALLFDGLDEVPDRDRAACVAWLNDLCTQFPTVPIAVVSRTSEFAWLSRPLMLNGVAEIQPLTRQKVEEYLSGAGPAAASIHAALVSDQSLWEVFDAPIWLMIMTLTLKDAAETAAEGSVEEGRRRLLDRFVATAVHRQRPADRYTAEQTVRWLSQLARLSRGDLRLSRAFVGAPNPERTANAWTAAALVAANTIAAGAVTLPLLRSYGLAVTLATGLFPLGFLLGLAFVSSARPAISPFAGLALGWLVVHYEPRVIPGFRGWLSNVGVSWMMHYSAPSGPDGGGGPDINLHKWITDDQFRDLIALFVPGVLAVMAALAFVRGEDLDDEAAGLSVTAILCPIVALTPFVVGMAQGARVTGPFQAYYYGTGAIGGPALIAGVLIALPFRGVRLLLEPLSSTVGSTFRALQSFAGHLAARRVPLRLRRFLRQAADHYLLIRDRSGYRFPHALLHDYFASLDPAAAAHPGASRSESPQKPP